MLEDEIEGRLHKTVWITMIPFSVSQVNQTLSVFFFLFWIVITTYVACALDFLPGIHDALWRLMITIAVIALGIVSLACDTSDLRGSWPKDDGSHDDERFKVWSWWCNREKKSRQFIRRYAPGNDEPVA